MIAFIIIFFLAVVGIAAYFISTQAKKRSDGTEPRPPAATTTTQPSVGRATGRGDN